MEMKEFLTITEFSKLSGIEKSTLRYWDEIGLFSPMHRDNTTKYRYYTPEQIILVNFITVMSDLEIPLKTISDVANSRTPQKVVSMIEDQEMRLDMEMRKLRQRYSVIHTRRELINYGMKVEDGYMAVDAMHIEDEEAEGDVDVEREIKEVWVDIDKVAVLNRSERSFVMGPRNKWVPGNSFYEYFMTFCDMAEELRVNLSFPIGGYHDDMDSFMKGPGEPDYFFSLDPTGNRRREAGRYLCGFSKGYYGDFGDLPQRLAAYAKENKLTLHGPVYTLYLIDEVCLDETDQYLAQICVAVM